MQLVNISIHIPSLVRIERGLVGYPRARTCKVATFLTEMNCISMYICLLHRNHLLCQQAAIPAIKLCQISMHIPSLIRIERGLVGKPLPRNWKSATFLTEIHCISMYMCLLPHNQLLCQHAAVPAM